MFFFICRFHVRDITSGVEVRCLSSRCSRDVVTSEKGRVLSVFCGFELFWVSMFIFSYWGFVLFVICLFIDFFVCLYFYSSSLFVFFRFYVLYIYFFSIFFSLRLFLFCYLFSEVYRLSFFSPIFFLCSFSFSRFLVSLFCNFFLFSSSSSLFLPFVSILSAFRICRLWKVFSQSIGLFSQFIVVFESTRPAAIFIGRKMSRNVKKKEKRR